MKSILVILALVLPFALTSCAGSKTTESTGEVIDSSTITTKVKTKLLTDQHVDGLGINVDTFKDTVQLSGFVKSQAEKDRAGLLASQVAGVEEVVNNIEIKAE